MLCTSCQNQPHCLAAQLAQGDAALDQLLSQLKRCSLQQPRRLTLWQQLKTRLRSLWTRLRSRLWHSLGPQ
ncbi:MAG TPA: hypothetical protein VLS96_20640 [Nodosilinea sp.]|nr:hypothetical protein [Nodosilinea sp.]